MLTQPILKTFDIRTPLRVTYHIYIIITYTFPFRTFDLANDQITSIKDRRNHTMPFYPHTEILLAVFYHGRRHRNRLHFLYIIRITES